ncbi:uncharacterized protein LOC142765549 [Rhipicephalus microplus]|uniref:uncharacterized protein LOC142765549 n=1 Tax=Rhipicephalus microplus TaxID=6941 RepID=UPI003F6BB8FC
MANPRMPCMRQNIDLPYPIQQGDRVPDSASTESSFDSPQLMQGGAEGLLLLAQPPMDIGEKSEAQASIATPGPSGHAAGIQWEPVHEQELQRPQDMLAPFETPRRRKQAKVNTPEKAFLQARTARLASEQQRSWKATKNLQQFKRCLKKQNAEWKSVLKTLTKENIFLREQVSVLCTLDAANQHLLK